MKVVIIAGPEKEDHKTTQYLTIASNTIEDGDIIGCLELLVARLKNLANPTQGQTSPLSGLAFPSISS